MMVRRLKAIGMVLTMITALVVGLGQSATASSCEVQPPGGYLGYYICEYRPVDQFFWSERDGRGLWPVVGTDGQIYITMEDGYQTHRWSHWYSSVGRAEAGSGSRVRGTAVSRSRYWGPGQVAPSGATP
jgi:hypothetical protein